MWKNLRDLLVAKKELINDQLNDKSSKWGAKIMSILKKKFWREILKYNGPKKRYRNWFGDVNEGK